MGIDTPLFWTEFYVSGRTKKLFILEKSKYVKRYKIFVVEDNVLYAQVIKKQLLDHDYQVRVFYNGKDCIDSLADMPDLITLDYTLPDISGHEVLKEILRRLPDVHFIHISAH